MFGYEVFLVIHSERTITGSEFFVIQTIFDLEVLGQSDIDRLMQDADEEKQGVVYKPDGRRFDSDQKVKIDLYDFRNPIFLTEVEFRQLKIKYEAFLHYLGARLSLFLRMDFKIKLKELRTLTYEKLLETYTPPTFMSIFSIDRLDGVGILEIHSRLAMTIVNRMLGGRGHSAGEARNLTEVEMALIEEISIIILDEWCSQWKELKDLKPSLVGRETMPQFLQTAPHDANILVGEFEVEFGDCKEIMSLALPVYTIEPIVRYIQEQVHRFKHTEKEEKMAKWLNSYSSITLPLRAEWLAKEKMSIRDVLNLREGDIIELPKDLLQQAQVRLMNTPCFIGEIGVENHCVAVKIKNKIKEDDNE